MVNGSLTRRKRYFEHSFLQIPVIGSGNFCMWPRHYSVQKNTYLNYVCFYSFYLHGAITDLYVMFSLPTLILHDRIIYVIMPILRMTQIILKAVRPRTRHRHNCFFKASFLRLLSHSSPSLSLFLLLSRG